MRAATGQTDDHLPYGLIRCDTCRSIGYRYEHYCVCCGMAMAGWQPYERDCGQCGAMIEHAVAHFCGQCGSTLGPLPPARFTRADQSLRLTG